MGQGVTAATVSDVLAANESVRGLLYPYGDAEARGERTARLMGWVELREKLARRAKEAAPGTAWSGCGPSSGNSTPGWWGRKHRRENNGEKTGKRGLAPTNARWERSRVGVF